MAISIPSLDTLQEQIVGYWRTRFPTRDLSTESLFGKTARAQAMALLGFYKAVYSADNDATPGSATSDAAMDKWAILFGLSNGSGSYGRKGAVAASGGVVLITGTAGTNVPDATVGLAEDGVTAVETEGAVVIGGSGSVSATLIATTKGLAGNLEKDSVVTFSSPPAGMDATAKVTTALSGGLDKESTSALLDRLLLRLQSPPKGGAAADYRTWAETVSGVSRAYVYPLRGGSGTVHTAILKSGNSTNDGTKSSRIPSAALVASVQTVIDDERPVSVEDDKVYGPVGMTTGTTIRCRMVPSVAKYGFDWDDTAATYTVAAFSSVNKTIDLNTSAPGSLSAAVTNGSKPRLQVNISTSGYRVIPEQIEVTAVTAIAGPASRLTLKAWFTKDGGVTAIDPTVGDQVFSGGPSVATTAADVLTYVDGLGPSRASGYADSEDRWEDAVAVERVTQIALNAADTDKVRFHANIVKVAGVSQVLLNGSATTDLSPSDNSPSAGPEIAWATRILVTQ